MAINQTFSRNRRRKLMAEINVVPYIDVMLVLLIIFMVTAPLLTTGVDVDLPDADAKVIDTEQQEPFIVTVDADGNVYLNDNEEPVSSDQIQAAAAAVLRRKPNTNFLVRGDEGSLLGHTVKAMATLQQAGVPSVGIVTEAPSDN